MWMRFLYFVPNYIFLTSKVVKATVNNMSRKLTFRKIKFVDCSSFIKKLVLPLDKTSYKGVNGRIAVIGGSPDYTGAPYYSAQSSLKFGGDLSYVFCSKQSSIPIKSYSPEFMVSSFYDADKLTDDSHYNHAVNVVTEVFPRIHTIVIGPGLGRDIHVHNIVTIIITKAIESKIPFVIDADGLFLISQNLNLIKNYQRCILTPNKVEFERLVTSAIEQLIEVNSKKISTPENKNCIVSEMLRDNLESNNTYIKLQALCQYLGGVTILLKGANDLISSGGDVIILDEEGSPRRCGGQGDILAGNLGVAMHWALKYYNNLTEDSCIFPDIENQDIIQVTTIESSERSQLSTIKDNNALIWASILASTVTKRASALAFSVKKRSMTSPDVIEYIGQAFQQSIEE